MDGHTLQLAKFTGRHAGGDFSATGQIDFANLRDPVFQIAVTSDDSSIIIPLKAPGTLTGFIPVAATRTALSQAERERALSPFLPLDLTAALDLKISGPLSAGKVEGEARKSRIIFSRSRLILPDISLIEASSALPKSEVEWPQPFATTITPWDAWSYDVHCRFAPNARVGGIQTTHLGVQLGICINEGDLSAAVSSPPPEMDLAFERDGIKIHSRRESSGSTNLAASGGREELEIEEATWEFRPGTPRTPTLTLRLAGTCIRRALHR